MSLLKTTDVPAVQPAVSMQAYQQLKRCVLCILDRWSLNVQIVQQQCLKAGDTVCNIVV